LPNRQLGTPGDYKVEKKYFDSAGTLISTDIYNFPAVGVTTLFNYPVKINVSSDPTPAPDPDNRKTLRLDIMQDSDDKVIITPLICKYIAVSRQDCNTFYMRWLNSLGGWDYFLFENKIYEGDKVDSQGQYETYFDSISAITDFQNYVGKRTTPVVRVGCDFVDENIAKGLRSLKSSPKVYWYNQELSKWIGVLVDTGSFAYRTTRDNYSKVEFSVNLPRLLNQTA